MTTGSDAMNLLRYLVGATTALSDLRHPTAWLTDAIRGATPSASGIEVNANSALTASAVFACVRNVSEDLAKLPLILYRRLPAGGKDRAVTHPLHDLVKLRPNQDMTSLAMRQAVMICHRVISLT